PDTGIELRFSLPATVEAGELAFASTQQLSGPQAHQFVLPAAEAGSLVLVAAQASAELVLSLERHDVAAGWRTVGFERSKAPVLAVPSDGEAQRPWRVSVWAVDGGGAPFTIAARAWREQPQAPGQVTLTPLRLDGLDVPIALAQ